MSDAPTPIEIPEEVLRRVCAAARAAFPAECCGWLSGPAEAEAVDTVRPCANAQAAGDHPTVADRGAETAYVIDGEDLLALDLSFGSASPARIIYHSHPNGRAYFSKTDRAVATSPWGGGPTYPVQQLVVGLTAERITEAALFAWSVAEDGFVEIARFDLLSAASP